MYIKDGNATNTWLRVFVRLLLLLFFITASSNVAYSVDPPRSRTSGRTPNHYSDEYSRLQDQDPRSRGSDSGEQIYPPPDSNEAGRATPAEMPIYEVVTDEVVTDHLSEEVTARIAYYVDYFSDSDAYLTEKIQRIGYVAVPPGLPSASDAWRGFPAVRKIDTAYRAAKAEKSSPEGGNGFLVRLIYELSERYQSILDDDGLPEEFRAKAKNPAQFQPIRFAKIDAMSTPSGELPDEIKTIIKAIASYCDPCHVLGGMHGILENQLDAKDAFDILRNSKSNGEALELAASRLTWVDANARLKGIVGVLQANYESASTDPTFKMFMEWQPTQIEIDGPNLGVEISDPAPRAPFEVP